MQPSPATGLLRSSHSPAPLVLAVALASSLFHAPEASAATVGAAVAVQHRHVAQLAGPKVTYRSGGPGLVLTARGDGRTAPRARVDLARTQLGSGDEHWMARMEVERQRVAGPFYLGGRVSLEGEGTERHGVCSNRVQVAQTAGLRFDAGPARVRVGAGLPALGVLARPGRTALAQDLVDAAWVDRVAVPAALYATGPWNAPAIDLTGRASWTVPTGEAWVAVRTSIDRLDVDHLERRVTTVQPEVGFRWGRGESTSAAPPVSVPAVVVPPVVVVPPGVVPPELFGPPAVVPEAEAEAPEAEPGEPDPSPEPSGEAATEPPEASASTPSDASPT